MIAPPRTHSHTLLFHRSLDNHPLQDFFVTGNQQQPSSSAASDYGKNCSLIHLPVADMIFAYLTQIVVSHANLNAGKENIGHATKSIRSLRSTVQALFQITTILFDKPRNVFAQSLTAIGT